MALLSGQSSPRAVSGEGLCRDGSLGGDAAGEVQAGVPGGAYLPTRASLVLVHTTRASEISPRAACPTVDPPLEARGTGKLAPRNPPSQRVVRSSHDLSVVPSASHLHVSSAPPRCSPAVSSSAFSDPARLRPKNHQRAHDRINPSARPASSRGSCTTSSTRRTKRPSGSTS